MTAVDINKAVVRDLIEVVWRQGRLDALARFWTADCINHADPAPEKTGLDALRRYHDGFATFFASFSDPDILVIRQIGEGDLVTTQMLARMTHSAAFQGISATGRRVELATIRIDRFRDGLIAEHWSVGDLAGLLHQLSA